MPSISRYFSNETTNTVDIRSSALLCKAVIPRERLLKKPWSTFERPLNCVWKIWRAVARQLLIQATC
jgi:hypothetical protein